MVACSRFSEKRIRDHYENARSRVTIKLGIGALFANILVFLLLVPCGRLSWLSISFSAHVKSYL